MEKLFIAVWLLHSHTERNHCPHARTRPPSTLALLRSHNCNASRFRLHLHDTCLIATARDARHCYRHASIVGKVTQPNAELATVMECSTDKLRTNQPTMDQQKSILSKQRSALSQQRRVLSQQRSVLPQQFTLLRLQIRGWTQNHKNGAKWAENGHQDLVRMRRNES